MKKKCKILPALAAGLSVIMLVPAWSKAVLPQEYSAGSEAEGNSGGFDNIVVVMDENGQIPANGQAAGGQTEPSTGSEPAYGIESYSVGQIVEDNNVVGYNLDHFFKSFEITEGDEIYQRIVYQSYNPEGVVALSDLRYLKLLHYNFDGMIQVGELIVAADLAQDYLSIFKELFQNRYQIQSMRLIDDYWTGDGTSSDTNSIEHNNTSAFCYREVTGGASLSNHAFGRAIDLNPQQNPYVIDGWAYHDNAQEYIDRTTGYAHVITHDDLAYEIFTDHGFTWGGDWDSPKDYQHFQKE